MLFVISRFMTDLIAESNVFPVVAESDWFLSSVSWLDLDEQNGASCSMSFSVSWRHLRLMRLSFRGDTVPLFLISCLLTDWDGLNRSCVFCRQSYDLIWWAAWCLMLYVISCLFTESDALNGAFVSHDFLLIISGSSALDSSLFCSLLTICFRSFSFSLFDWIGCAEFSVLNVEHREI